MKPLPALRAVVRVITLLGWLVGFFYLVSAVIARLAPNHRAGTRLWWRYAVAAIFFFLIEWVLLRRADRVLVAYPIRSPSTAEAP